MTVRGRHLSTQTEYPWRTAIRTAISTTLLFLIAIAAVGPVVSPFAEQYIPDSSARILAFSAFCGGLVLILKRIAALPAVAELLVRLGIGAVPKRELRQSVSPKFDDDDVPETLEPEPLKFTVPD